MKVITVGTNTHTRLKQEVQKYISSFERFQEELPSFKEFRRSENLTSEMTIDLSETKDQMEAIRRYEARLQKGKDDPTWFTLTKMVTDVFFEMKREFEKLLQESMFFEGRKCGNLTDLTDYVVGELQELEAKLYSNNMDELECSVCNQSTLIIDKTRGEEICRSCGIVFRERIIEEELEINNSTDYRSLSNSRYHFR